MSLGGSTWSSTGTIGWGAGWWARRCGTSRSSTAAGGAGRIRVGGLPVPGEVPASGVARWDAAAAAAVVVNEQRFCVLPSVRRQTLASRVPGQALRRVGADYERGCRNVVHWSPTGRRLGAQVSRSEVRSVGWWPSEGVGLSPWAPIWSPVATAAAL